MLRLTDSTQLTIWLSNFPLVLTALIGLIAAPYAINKGTATFADIASMMSASKQFQANAQIYGNVGAQPQPPNVMVNSYGNAPQNNAGIVIDAPQVNVQGQVGTPGIKG